MHGSCGALVCPPWTIVAQVLLGSCDQAIDSLLCNALVIDWCCRRCYRNEKEVGVRSERLFDSAQRRIIVVGADDRDCTSSFGMK